MSLKIPVINNIKRALEKVESAVCRDFHELSSMQTSGRWSIISGNFFGKMKERMLRVLFEELSRFAEDFEFLLEDCNSIEGISKGFLICPISGENNFLNAIPHCAISISYVENGSIIATVVFSIISREIFWAYKGKGAYVVDVSGNNRKLRSILPDNQDYSKLSDCIMPISIDCNSIYTQKAQEHFKNYIKCDFINMGSPALDIALCAANRFKGVILSNNLRLVDYLGPMLLLEEAELDIKFIDDGDANILALAGPYLTV